MGPQQISGPGRCFMVAHDVSRRERSPTAPGGCASALPKARAPRLQSSSPSSLFEELTAGPAQDDGTPQEFTRLTPTNLARYQLYLSRTEDSASSMEEVVRTRSGRTLRMRPTRCRLQERPRKKRHVLQSMARPLKKWLIRHRDKPYPSKAEKLALAMGSHMTLEQVSNWFANARRRLKNTVYIPGMNWGDRIRQYNNFISGNTEPLSISSDDSIWDSDCEQHDGGCVDEKGSLAQGARRESQPRVELFEHSYSSNALHKGGGLHAALTTATPPRGAPKRARCPDGESGPGGKRPRPSCDSDSPSENDDEDSDDDSTTAEPADEPQPAPPHPPPQRRPLTAPPQAAPPCGVKRRLFDSPDSSSPAFKKYKTSMLLRYIGADERESPGGGSQAASRQPRPLTAKRPREEQQPAAKTAEPKKAAREGQRPAAKKRKCAAEPPSALRWTEIEAAEALTHLSQSSALCWSRQPQQQRVA
ncbi:uncharacterized protein LOC144126007 [Amblyomma americanum]